MDPYLTFGILFTPIIANPDTSTDVSSGDNLCEKTEKWPSLSFMWPLTKNFLLWIEIHIHSFFFIRRFDFEVRLNLLK